MYSEAGPGSPCQGLEWVVHTGRARVPGTTLRARSVHPGRSTPVALPVPGTRFPVKTRCKRQNGEIS